MEIGICVCLHVKLVKWKFNIITQVLFQYIHAFVCLEYVPLALPTSIALKAFLENLLASHQTLSSLAYEIVRCSNIIVIWYLINKINTWPNVPINQIHWVFC